MFVSILGDSISTFPGYQPEGYAVYYDREKQIRNGINSAHDLWWARVIQGLGAELCVNNAYSGSRVTGTSPASGNSTERTHGLHTSEYRPDLILVYLGTNDWGYGVPLRNEKPGLLRTRDVGYFDSAYRCMLNRIIKYYPKARIACGTISRSYLRTDSSWVFPEAVGGTRYEKYNDIIRSVAQERKCILIDADARNIPYETLDGFHPTARGHATIADNWLSCFSEIPGFLSPDLK